MRGIVQPTGRKTPSVLVRTEGDQVVCYALPARLGPVTLDFATTALSTRICRTSAFSDWLGWTAHRSALSMKYFPIFGENAKGYSVHEHEADRRPGQLGGPIRTTPRYWLKAGLESRFYLVE